MKDIDERIPGGVRQRFSDITNAKRIAAAGQLVQGFQSGKNLRDQEKKGEGHVEQERYTEKGQQIFLGRPSTSSNSYYLHHRFGYYGSCVLDFFRHVCDRVLPEHDKHT